MTRPPLLLLIATGIAGICMSGLALAHAMLESSSPANHARLRAAPKTFELTFGHPVKLTRLKLIGGGLDMPFELDPATAAAKSISVALPALSPASYQVQWSALATDGHAMTGRLEFSISGN